MISAPVVCPHLVGRQRELAFLVERRRDLSKTHGGLVLVGGDAGIGKSRLLREFLDATGKSRGRVAIARCRPFAVAPYEPLTDLLGTLAPAAARIIPAQTQAAQLRALADAVIDAGQKHAIVGIIEDLHWSDSGTLGVLQLLAERLATSRVLLVATYRANELGPEHPHYIAVGALQRSRSVATIALTPLAAHEMREFIDAASQAAGGVPLDVRREVARVAEGNPFFTEELLRDVIDRRGAGPLDRSLPTSIHAAILERVAPLAPADRAILRHAAVIGRRFGVNVLAHTLDTDVDAILPALQRARVLQIVEESSDPATFLFRHALTREAIYDELLTAQRRPLHRRIALALEAQPAASLDALAYHWWAAGDRAKALAYGERGGDAAQNVHGYADAIACYERTLGLLDPADGDAARVRTKVGTSYFRAGFMDRAIEYYRHAWAFVERTADDASFALLVANKLAASMYNHGQTQESAAFLHDALPVIARCGDRGMSERARLTYASYLVESGDVAQTREFMNSIDADLIGDDPKLTLLYWQTVCRLCELEGDVAGIRAAAARIYAIAEQPSEAYFNINGLTEAITSALNVGDTALARGCLERAIPLCITYNGVHSHEHGNLLVTSALERCLSGAYEEARALVLRGMPMIGDVLLTRHSAVLAALAVGTALDDRELLAHEPDAAFIDLAFEARLPFVFGPLVALCAPLLAARGEPEAAHRLLRRGVRAATTAVPSFGSFPLVVVGAEMCQRMDADDVRALCRVTRGGGPAPAAAAELAQALLARRFGDAGAARAPARRAAAAFADIGWPLYEALAHEAAGETAVAQQIRQRIGYRARGTGRLPAGDGSTESLLTNRENQVARLVAGGRTNREIAAELSVSVGLVEKLLTSIYGKLVITSRSQLTAYIVARDPGEPRPAG